MNARLTDLTNYTTVTTPDLMSRLEPKPRTLPTMLALHDQLESMFREHIKLDDEITDAVGAASSAVSKAIIAAPVTCLADIADKFRFAARLIEEEGGMLYDEEPAVIAAVADLLQWRNAEWQEIQPGGVSPWHAQIRIQE